MKEKKLFKPVLKSFNCGSCGATLNITAVGISITMACPSCHSLIDIKDPNYKILKKVSEKSHVTPLIPIGSKGKISGKNYQCIGFLQKQDQGYYWVEYLLFNPYHGFRWLTESDGHWTFFKRVRTISDIGYQYITYKGKKFRIFNRSQGKVIYVEGEFYWRVKVGDTSYLSDYISPPYMASLEKSADEKIWTIGSYIDRKRIEEAFKLKNLPEPMGVGANQPSPIKNHLKNVSRLFVSSLVCCFLIFLFRSILAGNETIFKQTFPLQTKSLSSIGAFKVKHDLVKSETFTVHADKKNLQVSAFAGLNNSWLELDILLVDVNTGKGIPLPTYLEYFKGYDYEEGSRSKSWIKNYIPKGEYYLSIIPMSDNKKNNGLMFEVKLTSDVTRGTNFLITLAFLFIPFIITGLRSRKFEVDRWGNGSENPYTTQYD